MICEINYRRDSNARRYSTLFRYCAKRPRLNPSLRLLSSPSASWFPESESCLPLVLKVNCISLVRLMSQRNIVLIVIYNIITSNLRISHLLSSSRNLRISLWNAVCVFGVFCLCMSLKIWCLSWIALLIKFLGILCFQDTSLDWPRWVWNKMRAIMCLQPRNPYALISVYNIWYRF